MFVDTMHEPASWIIARCIKVNKQSTANVKDKYYELFSSQGGKGLERNEDMEEG